MALGRGAAVALMTGVMASTAALAGCSSLPLPGRRAPQADTQAGIGVNAFLWRATLDTLAFLPLLNADPWGGVINYDWYSTAQAPNERFKATVFILDRRLRADALNVSLTREVRNEAGDWVVTPPSGQTATDLENAILTRARQLNLAHAG